jgi:hypothetical protein
MNEEGNGMHNGGVSNEKVALWQRGDRVALVNTADPFTDLRPGDTGLVVRYDASLAILYVNWENGSCLSMLLEDGDEVHKIG